MEQESTKELKRWNRLTSEQFRCFVYFVVIACLLSCIVVLFVSMMSIETRLTAFDSKFSEISNELESIRSKIDAERSLNAARRKRSAKPTTSLSDLTKRLIALESR